MLTNYQKVATREDLSLKQRGLILTIYELFSEQFFTMNRLEQYCQEGIMELGDDLIKLVELGILETKHGKENIRYSLKMFY